MNDQEQEWIKNLSQTLEQVTWNCTHIANAAIRGKIEETCRGAGLPAPIICTPEELMEASDHA